MRAVISFAALAALTALAPNAAADDTPAPTAADGGTIARERYAAATRAYAGLRYAEAALYFEAAAAERAHALTLFSAAIAWEQANAPERAADDYVRAIATPGLPPDKLSAAKEKLASLQAVLGRVEVTAPGDAWFVQLDGNTEQAAPSQLHGAPGVHTLSVRAPGRPIERRSVLLVVAQSQRLELQSAPSADSTARPREEAAPVAVLPTAAHQASSGAQVRKTIGLVTLGVGVAALASGAVLGLQALDARDAYNATPTRGGFDHADSLQGWTNIAFISGAVFVVGGALLVFWPAREAGPAAPAAHGRAEPPREREPQRARVFFAPTLGGGMLGGSF